MPLPPKILFQCMTQTPEDTDIEYLAVVNI